MNPATEAKSIISNLEQIIQELNSEELGEGGYNYLYDLESKYYELAGQVKQLTRLIPGGKMLSEFEQDFSDLKEFATNYSDEFLESKIPQKLKNKNVVVDSTELEKLLKHAKTAINYFENLPKRYKDYISKVKNLLPTGKYLEDNLQSFKLTEQDIPKIDYLLADDGPPQEFQAIHPAQFTSRIKAKLQRLAKYVKNIENKFEEIKKLAWGVWRVDLEKIIPNTNKKNQLVQRAFKQMQELNKLIYQGNFSNTIAIRKEYWKLLEMLSEHLPRDLGNKITRKINHLSGENIDQTKSIKEEALNFKKQPMSQWVSPWTQNPDLEPDPVTDLKFPVPIGAPVTPRQKEEYESLWKGRKVTPEEKARYEKLWEVANKINKNIKRGAK